MLKALYRLFYTHLEDISKLCEKFFSEKTVFLSNDFLKMADASVVWPYYLYYEQRKLQAFFVLTSYTDCPEGILIALDKEDEIIKAIKKKLNTNTVRLNQNMSCASLKTESIVNSYSEYIMKRVVKKENIYTFKEFIFSGNGKEEKIFYNNILKNLFCMEKEEREERLKQVFYEKDFQVFFLMLPSKKIVGSFGCYFGKNTISLFDIAVLSEYQNKGYAKKMLLSFFKKMEDKKKEYLLQVCSENKPAVALYQSLGFEVVQQQDYLMV